MASAPHKKPLNLTAREREVLVWSSKGMSARDVGLVLDIAKRTVDEHAQTAVRKLGAANKTQAVAIAISQHIIDFEAQCALTSAPLAGQTRARMATDTCVKRHAGRVPSTVKSHNTSHHGERVPLARGQLAACCTGGGGMAGIPMRLPCA